MSERFVLDCSATMKWCFADEATPKSDAWLAKLRTSARAVVPGHWSLEVANSLRWGTRDGRIKQPDAIRFLSVMAALPIDVDVETHAQAIGGSTLLYAFENGLTSYDAAYLELAIRRGLPLLTADGPLSKAAKARGVEVSSLLENEDP